MFLKLSRSDVIAIEGVVAVETTRPVRLLTVAVSESTANAGGVAPDHLRKVAPGSFEVRVAVGILGLLLVPAVRSGTGELDPGLVVGRWRRHGREVAARAFLLHVLMSALLDVFAGSVSERRVPDQILSAVKTTPVPVGAHDSADEVGVVLVGGIVGNKIAAHDLVRGSSNRRSHCKSKESSEYLHVAVPEEEE